MLLQTVLAVCFCCCCAKGDTENREGETGGYSPNENMDSVDTYDENRGGGTVAIQHVEAHRMAITETGVIVVQKLQMARIFHIS